MRVNGETVICAQATLKEQVRAHWEAETCGVRYGETGEQFPDFDEIARVRYEIEPYIPPFARFHEATGKRVLEIGVGAGSDFENWCKFADHATGVDLTDMGIRLTTERLRRKGVAPDRFTLQQADAEKLPFEDATFDLVYSWGVLHHTPDTKRAFGEALRVLKPGGTIRAMVYHAPSWVGLMLVLKHMATRRTFRISQKEAIFASLESPGTKAYSVDEGKQLVVDAGFSDVRVWSLLSCGDLLSIKLSSRYQNPIYRLIHRLYPRPIIRLLGHRFGTNLLIEATKPIN